MALMRGAHSVRFVLQDYLDRAIPTKIDQAQEQWGIDYTIPQFENVLPYEPVRMPHLSGPLLAIGVGQARNMDHVGTTPAAEEVYEVTYTVQLMMWVLTPEEYQGKDSVIDPETMGIALVATQRLRDDLAGIVRATLLDDKTFDSDIGIQIVESTLAESYSDVEQTSNAGVYVAACFFTFEVRFAESQYYETFGHVPAEGVELSTYLLDASYYTIGEGADAGNRIQPE